jgi:hypothetical protein
VRGRLGGGKARDVKTRLCAGTPAGLAKPLARRARARPPSPPAASAAGAARAALRPASRGRKRPFRTAIRSRKKARAAASTTASASSLPDRARRRRSHAAACSRARARRRGLWPACDPASEQAAQASAHSRAKSRVGRPAPSSGRLPSLRRACGLERHPWPTTAGTETSLASWHGVKDMSAKASSPVAPAPTARCRRARSPPRGRASRRSGPEHAYVAFLEHTLLRCTTGAFARQHGPRGSARAATRRRPPPVRPDRIDDFNLHKPRATPSYGALFFRV